MVSFVNASKKLVVQNERLIVPASRASRSRAENPTAVVDSEVEGTGCVGVFEPSMLVLESSETFLQDDVTGICRSNGTMEASTCELGG